MRVRAQRVDGMVWRGQGRVAWTWRRGCLLDRLEGKMSEFMDLIESF